MTSGPDKLIRVATALVVVAVAAFAAIVSYSHIFDLGYTHGQQGAAGRLLPLSVDGLILAASLVLLHEARNARSAPVLARIMLWLGIIATITANVAYGATFGMTGAIISAWPAVAFIGSAEMAMGLVRRARRADAPRRQIQTDSITGVDDTWKRLPDLVPQPSPDPVPTRMAEPQPAAARAPHEAEITPSAAGHTQMPSRPNPPRPPTRRPTRRRPEPATPELAEVTFAAELAEGKIPSLRAVRREIHVGTDRAREIRKHLVNVAGTRRSEA